MKTDGTNMERDGLLEVARKICIAARTAPKAKGSDYLVTMVLTGTEKDEIAEEMERIGEETGVAFFIRDANCLRSAAALVLLGTKIKTLGVSNCGFCGFKDCAENEKNQGICAFNTGDLGIAVGSAASIAADHRVDNRIFFTAGRAAINLNTLGSDVKIAYGIPLSVNGKNIFFDRKLD
jgi:uncharacterized ferredoxin-like protein